MTPQSRTFHFDRHLIAKLAMRIMLPCMGVMTLIAGVLGVVSYALMPMFEYVVTRNWERTTATIEWIEWHEHGRGMAWPFPMVEVRYRYVIDGQEYFGERLGFHSGVERDRARVAGMIGGDPASGQDIAVWVDPDDPARVLALRHLDWRLVTLGVPALFACVLGVLMVLLGMMSWSERTLISEFGRAEYDHDERVDRTPPRA